MTIAFAVVGILVASYLYSGSYFFPQLIGAAVGAVIGAIIDQTRIRLS
jgi:hypothetical protein